MSNLGSFILAIDTASRCGSIAAVRNGSLVGVWGVDAGVKQSCVLWDDVAMLLDRLETSIEEVTSIAVATGPGAFTGLRIGISAAAGIAKATGAALFGATTLELSARSSGTAGDVLVVLNAYRNEIYAQRLRVTPSGDVVSLADPVVGPPAAIFGELGCESARIVGDGAEVYRDQLEAEAERCGVGVEWSRVSTVPVPATWSVMPAALCLAGDLAELVALRIERGAEPGPVVPSYVRASEAELNLKAGRLPVAPVPKGN